MEKAEHICVEYTFDNTSDARVNVETTFCKKKKASRSYGNKKNGEMTFAKQPR